MKDYYNILGVEPDASETEIRRMYHKLSKKYHPDANISDPDLRKWADERMKELNEAYQTLSNPQTRARYDREQGYARGQSGMPPPRPPVSQLRQSVVLRSAGINALIFGLFGLLRGGLPFALSGAVIGAVIGAVLGNIRISGLSPAISQGLLMGMLVGAFVLKPPLAGIIAGAALGALGGWYLSKR